MDVATTAEAMDCKISLVKVLIAGLILTLLLMAVSGCAPKSNEEESLTSADENTTEITQKAGLPTYERNPSKEDVPSETRFGDGDYGKREELSDVEP